MGSARLYLLCYFSLMHVLYIFVFVLVLPHDDAVFYYCHFSRSLWLSRTAVEGARVSASRRRRSRSPLSPRGPSPSPRRRPAHPKVSTCSAARAPPSWRPIRATFSRPTAATGAASTRSLASNPTSRRLTSCSRA